MSFSILSKAIATAARDFAGHTGHAPHNPFWPSKRPPLVPRLDEDPFGDATPNELERIRLRLLAQPGERAARLAAQRRRMDERRAALVGAVA